MILFVLCFRRTQCGRHVAYADHHINVGLPVLSYVIIGCGSDCSTYILLRNEKKTQEKERKQRK